MAQQPVTADLLRLALEAYRDEYRDLSESWRNLDTKAQGLVAIAGIFLAAVFAWTRDLPTTFGTCERLLLVGSCLSLVAAVIAAIWALFIKMMSAPPLGEGTAHMVRDILRKSKKDLGARTEALYNDQITLWKKTNEEMRKHILVKARCIKFGQGALVLAAVLVSVLAVGTVF